MENIQSIISKSVIAFIKTVSKQYKISSMDLSKLWNENNKELKTFLSNLKKNEMTVKIGKTEKEEKVEQKQPKKIEKIEKPVGLVTTCPYVFSKGQKQGQTCGVKSKNGEEFCSIHRKKDGSKSKRNSTVSTSNSITSRTSNDTAVSGSSIILKKYGDNLIHVPTNLIFDKATKSVIGKMVNDKILVLTTEDTEICNKWRFKIFDEVKKHKEMAKAEKEKESVKEEMGEKDKDNQTEDNFENNSIEEIIEEDAESIKNANEAVKKILGF